MKVISDSLELVWERWDDPGDYPNAVASHPLPSYHYPVVEGEIIVEAENQEDIDSFDCISDWVWDYIDLDVNRATWKSKINGNVCTIWVEECEADFPEDDGPEWDEA